MKNIIYKYALLLIILSLLNTGCSSDESPEYVSSIYSQEQLQKSKTASFVKQLEMTSEENRDSVLIEFIKNNPASPVIEDGGVVMFYWYGKAGEVLINGDIQKSWTQTDTLQKINCGAQNFFYKFYTLPEDTRIDYLYLVDGKESLDPRNPIVTPSGFSEHSQLAMPLFKADTLRNLNPNIEHGLIDSFYFTSKKTSIHPRRIKIYMPSGYDSLSSLPAVYVNDGFKAIDFSGYINVLDNLISSKKIKPVVVVFIDFVEGDQNNFLNNFEGYSKFICDELVPEVDQKYKTADNPEARVIAGISAGGHISLITALNRPDVFLNAAGQSSTVTEALLNAAENFKKAKGDMKLFIDIGRFDLITDARGSFLYSNQVLHKKLNEAGVNHHFKIVNDGHQWASWRERSDDILIYFFGNDG